MPSFAMLITRIAPTVKAYHIARASDRSGRPAPAARNRFDSTPSDGGGDQQLATTDFELGFGGMGGMTAGLLLCVASAYRNSMTIPS